MTATIRPRQFRRDDRSHRITATLAFVARTDVIGADAAADYSTALEQAAATSVIWVVIGTGPVAAAGLDQIEAAQRELDSMGIRSIRTLVAESLEIGAEWFDTHGEVPDQQCIFCVSCQ
ncbi:hypothetical protein J6397_12455 [Rhodococcus qingshengii]|uniref:hypothetical protein n=1 Tax=Rhodococcus qingshengii TaxID=334542 RepID=UPI001AE11A51|nr:hypothetical protein [Rhodococcus qingshengii]MBP1050951.1 hypothetical protein [Rhodococcus qingshengii]WCT02774.1 hypothetical protein PI247_00255 [Rhodococcus qingshengii]